MEESPEGDARVDEAHQLPLPMWQTETVPHKEANWSRPGEVKEDEDLESSLPLTLSFLFYLAVYLVSHVELRFCCTMYSGYFYSFSSVLGPSLYQKCVLYIVLVILFQYISHIE